MVVVVAVVVVVVVAVLRDSRFFHFIFVSVVESRKLRSVAPTAEISFRISLPTNFGIFFSKNLGPDRQELTLL